jgi:hypothetical protein
MNERATDDPRAEPPRDTARLDLAASELELVRTALRLLESTLGHEEADELEDVQSLLARLPSPERR